jgi:NADH dehydrogenase
MINIPETKEKRIVIVGAGFAGISIAQRLCKQGYQIVLIDKNNYHQFQPLFYQVAMSGLEPASIAFPLRKMFQRQSNVFIRVTKVERVDTVEKVLHTPFGIVNYDYLIIAIGADTNFYGNENIQKYVIPMKSVTEALTLRNRILEDYEEALTIPDYEDRQQLMDIVIVGGGATGVEVAGALAEMKKYILPKDYHEMNYKEIDIYIIQSADRLLKGMSDNASEGAEKFLTDLGVIVKKNVRVNDFDGHIVSMDDGTEIKANKVIWAAGITGNVIKGLPEESHCWGNRLKVNRHCQVEGVEDVFAIGDIAYMEEEAFPKGHPQVAQVAIQMGKWLAKNFSNLEKEETVKGFVYKDLGSMATIGRNRAVVDLPNFKYSFIPNYRS